MLIRHFPFVGIYQYFRFLFFVYLPHRRDNRANINLKQGTLFVV